MVEPFMSSGSTASRQRPDPGRGDQVRDIARAGRLQRLHLAEAARGAEMERVMDATTLPTLLLGGDPSGPPEET